MKKIVLIGYAIFCFTTSLAQVSSTDPENNANNVPLNSDITIVFNSSVTNVDSSTIVVTSLLYGPISGDFMGMGSPVIVFDPDSPFISGDIIRVTITDAVDGTSYNFQFITASAGVADPLAFPSKTISSNTIGAFDVSIIDLDRDGHLDILGAANSGDDILWYRNDGNTIDPNFIQFTVIADLVNGASSVAAADLDNDGDIDLISTSQFDDTLAWYRNDGSGPPTNPILFTEIIINNLVDGAFDAVIADINNDGNLDIVSAALNGDTIDAFINDGNANFTRQEICNCADGARSVAVGDFDNDGDLDVVSASFNDDTVSWYENLGGVPVAFSTERFISNGANGAHAVDVGDIDGDGDMDIVAVSANDDEITWYENIGIIGTNSFPTFNTIIIGNGIMPYVADAARDVTIGDIDGDSNLDILVVSSNDDTVRLLINNGLLANPMFSETIINDDSNITNNPFGIAFGDMDNDNDLDIVTASQVDNKVVLFRTMTANRVALSLSENFGSEDNTTNVTVSANSEFPVFGDQTVDVVVTGTDITMGDYLLGSFSITILDGQSSGSVTFTIVDDAVSENTETAILTLANPTFGIMLGEASTISDTITIVDNDNLDQGPIAICQNISVTLDISGSITVNAMDIDNGSVAPLGLDTISVTPNVFDCSNVGQNTVVFTITDIMGSDASCLAMVTVFSNSNDEDCDGVDVTEDCDDNDPLNTSSNLNDMDCDGVVSNDDCDDSDPGNTGTISNGDCELLSITDSKLDDLYIFPNPSDGIFYLNGISNGTIIKDLILYDIRGTIIKQPAINTNKIDIRRLDSGIYFLKLVSDYDNKVLRLLKN